MSNKFSEKLILITTAIVLILVAAVGSGVSIKAGHLHQDVQIAAKVQPASIISTGALPQSAHANSLRATVHVKELGTSGNLWLALWRIPSLLITFAIVYLILKTTVAIADGIAFTQSNIVRLRVLGAVLVATTFIKLLTDYARQQLIGYSLHNVDLLPISVAYFPTVAGLAMFFVAEAFVAGKKAVESTDGLV